MEFILGLLISPPKSLTNLNVLNYIFITINLFPFYHVIST